MDGDGKPQESAGVQTQRFCDSKASPTDRDILSECRELKVAFRLTMLQLRSKHMVLNACHVRHHVLMPYTNLHTLSKIRSFVVTPGVAGIPAH
jgi:hypothetical protein